MRNNVAQFSGRPTLVSLDPLSLQILDYARDAYSAMGLGNSISRAVLVRRFLHAAPAHLSALVEASRTQGDRSVLKQEKHAIARALNGVQLTRRRSWLDVDPFPTFAEALPRHNPQTLDTVIATADRLFG